LQCSSGDILLYVCYFESRYGANVDFGSGDAPGARVPTPQIFFRSVYVHLLRINWVVEIND